jgi:hypothetical protein
MRQPPSPEFAAYTSFLVRFWYEPAEARWYGEVEHVQTHTRTRVTNVNDVIRFLAAQSTPALDLLERQQDDDGNG